MLSPVSLAVILPAYNEEAALPGLLSELIRILESSVKSYQVIVVDDGSRDGTTEVAERFKARHQQVDVVGHPANLGLGAAVRTGLRLVRTDYWCWLPSDGQFRPAELMKLLQCLKSGELVISYISNNRDRTLCRRILSYGYRKALIRAFGHEIRYFNGPALLPRSAVSSEQLVSSGFSITAEILIRALDNRVGYQEAPITIEERKGGRSKAISVTVFVDLLVSWTRLYWQIRLRPMAGGGRG